MKKVNLENQVPVDLLETEVLKDPLAHQALVDYQAMMDKVEIQDLLEIQGSQEEMDAMELMDVMGQMGLEGQPGPEENQVLQDLPQGEKEG